MPEPASSRSLEDILASIRRSLADETVDGLVELSSAAVDAARAEQARSLGQPAGAGPALPPTPAEALADDLLRDKLAGALVLETESGEEDLVEDDTSVLDEEPTDPASDDGSDKTTEDNGALAKLWVLRPGIEQARPAAPTPSQSLSLDPFAGARPTQGEGKSAASFDVSPLELLGGAPPLTKPAPGMPPLPQSAAAPAPPVAPARASNGSGPPRLDPASIALLQKLRASNAAAIEKIAQSNVESEEAQAPEAAAAEPAIDAIVEPEVPVAEVPTVAPDAPLAEAPPVPAPEPAAAFPFAEPDLSEPDLAGPQAAEHEARPLLSLPERSTPLFGAEDDARPQLTSGVEHLLPETGAAPLQVEDVVADVVVPEPDVAPVSDPAPVAEIVAEPVAEALPQVQVEAPPEMEAVTEPDPPASASVEVAAEDPQTATPAGNKALEDMIAAVLEPVLQRLIETSIGPALEVLVRREVERALKEQRPPE